MNTSTNNSGWYDRETKQIELERRLISDERYGEAVLLYPQLKGAEENVAAMQRKFLEDELEWRKQQLEEASELMIQLEAGSLDESTESELWKSINKESQRWAV